ncbi:MAG: hypothetical protein N4A35_04125 [Flavobacteriales bacterium]|jgi:hypothetical protein|nr:hypothetical protein [Flavobacteriales bacterium]
MIIDNNNYQEKLYSESGKSNLILQLITYTILSFIVGYVSYVYTIITIKIPIIYINFLLIIGYAILIGVLIRVAFRFSHNRNKKERYIVSILVSTIGFISQWLTYFVFLITDGTPSLLDVITHSITIFENNLFYTILKELYTIGSWAIFGIDVNGYILLLIWLIELTIIILVPILIIKQYLAKPYSEQLNKWYTKYILADDFESIAAPVSLLQSLDLNPINTLEELNKGTGQRHTKIYIYYLEREDIQYISFERISIINNTKKSYNLINGFQINNEQAKYILSQYHYQKEILDIF